MRGTDHCIVLELRQRGNGALRPRLRLAVAALTQCSVPDHLQMLGPEHGLGPLEPMQVAAYRSRASQGSRAVDSLHRMLVQTLRHAAT